MFLKEFSSREFLQHPYIHGYMLMEEVLFDWAFVSEIVILWHFRVYKSPFSAEKVQTWVEIPSPRFQSFLEIPLVFHQQSLINTWKIFYFIFLFFCIYLFYLFIEFYFYLFIFYLFVYLFFLFMKNNTFILLHRMSGLTVLCTLFLFSAQATGSGNPGGLLHGLLGRGNGGK